MSTLGTPSKPFPYLHCTTLQHSWGAANSTKNNVTESIEVPALMRKKRKRSCSSLRPPKNVEELESQRMVHITVERNRRKQMNEHLALLRTLMPTYYVQRGDQASIVGAAVEFVKELEQILHSLKGEKQRREECIYSCIQQEDHYILNSDEGRSNPWKGFEITTTAISSPAPTSSSSTSIYSSNNEIISRGSSSNNADCSSEGSSYLARSGLHGHAKHDNSPDCEVEVKVKVVGIDSLLVNVMFSEKMGGKLLQIMNALQFGLKLTIRQLNVTTIDHSALYSFHVQGTGKDIDNNFSHIKWLELIYDKLPPLLHQVHLE